MSDESQAAFRDGRKNYGPAKYRGGELAQSGTAIAQLGSLRSCEMPVIKRTSSASNRSFSSATYKILPDRDMDTNSAWGTSRVRPSAIVILNGRRIRIASRKASIVTKEFYRFTCNITMLS
jgi:hypothetical protein